MRRGLRWLSPSTLAGRTTLALLAGLLVSHFGSVWLLEHGVRATMEEARTAHILDHVAMAARVLEALPEAVRGRAAAAVSSPGFEASWAPVPPADVVASDDLASLRRALRARLPKPDGSGSGSSGQPMQVRGALRLADSSWVWFSAPAPDLAPVPAHASLASLSAMTLGIILVAALVVGWITRPLTRLAEAANGFGKGGATVPLPETGPWEVHEAARAFNAMQARIARLIADRTQALASVSHDLRTPIQRLRLRAGFLDDKEVQAAVETDLDDMETMVDSTLAYLRGQTETEQPRQIDLAVVLRTLCDDAADRGAAVGYSGPDHLVLPVRPLAIKRALANLIDNAVKYGGRASVSLEMLGDRVQLTIDDEGPGIPEHELEAAFEPFHRLEQSRNRDTGGSGLGLTIARQAIASEGGSVRLSNRPGGGLRALVELPRRLQGPASA